MKTFLFGWVCWNHSWSKWHESTTTHDFATIEEAMTEMREWNSSAPMTGTGTFYVYWLKAIVDRDVHGRPLS